MECLRLAVSWWESVILLPHARSQYGHITGHKDPCTAGDCSIRVMTLDYGDRLVTQAWYLQNKLNMTPAFKSGIVVVRPLRLIRNLALEFWHSIGIV